MAADEDEENQSRAATRSSMRRVPWNPSSSKWQSSFGCPLAHTSLRAYLSPQKEKKLKEKAPVEALQKQYYNESIKFSYVQGLFDSHEVNRATKQRNCAEPQDSVKVVLREPETELPQPHLRAIRKRVLGRRCTKSSVE